MFDRDKFYYWLQRELEQKLRDIYKIHRIEVFRGWFSIWFLNNEDAISIPLNIMEDIYNSGKPVEKLTATIDAEYIARIKK